MVVEWQDQFEDLLVKTSSPYTLIRYAAGVYDENGRYNQPDPTESTIQAHIQPLNGIEKQELPEGRRNLDSIKIYSDDELRGVDSESKLQPDRIVYNSKTYEVYSSKIRNVHYKSLAVRIER